MHSEPRHGGNMGNVVIVSSYPFEDTNATKARLEAFCAVVGEVYDLLLLCKKSVVKGETKIRRVEVPALELSTTNFFLRGIGELLFSMRMLLALRKTRPDVAIVTVPSMFLLLAGSIKAFPIVFDVRDLVWDYLPSDGALRSLIKKVLTRFSYAMLARAATILVTNEAEKKAISENLSKSVPIQVVSNGISKYRYSMIVESGDKGLGRAPNDRPNVLYVGNIGLAQDLSTLVRAAKNKQEMDFTIVGKGGDSGRVQKLIGDLGLSNVRMVGGVSWEELADYYAAATVLYAQIVDGYDSAIPSKLYEYLAVGVPIIYGGVGASKEFASAFSGISIVVPSDDQDLQSSLESVGRLQGELDVDKNREIIRERFLREDQAQALKPVLRDVLSLANRDLGVGS